VRILEYGDLKVGELRAAFDKTAAQIEREDAEGEVPAGPGRSRKPFLTREAASRCLRRW
jgi:hypothetical protein